MRLVLLALAAIGVASLPAGASAARDTTRVDTEWKVTASGSQQFSWTASADGGQPQCGDPHGAWKVRTVTGSGSFNLPFSTPRAYRMATVQVVHRAAKAKPYRSLGYRPRGVPKLEDQVELPVKVAIAGQFTDQILACDAFDASTVSEPATGCGEQAATLDLRFGFGIIDATTRNDAALTGTLVRPWFIGADGKTTCPTYASAALSYFDGGRDTAACPDVTALHPGGTDGPETGLAKFFTKGRYGPALLAARPKAFQLTVDKPIDCTLTASDSYLPPVAPGGTLHITGALHYVWTFTPRKVTGAPARTKPL